MMQRKCLMLLCSAILCLLTGCDFMDGYGVGPLNRLFSDGDEMHVYEVELTAQKYIRVYSGDYETWGQPRTFRSSITVGDDAKTGSITIPEFRLGDCTLTNVYLDFLTLTRTTMPNGMRGVQIRIPRDYHAGGVMTYSSGTRTETLPLYSAEMEGCYAGPDGMQIDKLTLYFGEFGERCVVIYNLIGIYKGQHY